jgi:hypothetical protein
MILGAKLETGNETGPRVSLLGENVSRENIV